MQVIEFRARRIERARQARPQVVTCRGGNRAVRRDLLAWDRSGPGRYSAVVSSASWKPAMRDWACPEPGPRTQASARRVGRNSEPQ
jgi:hypothetical protein